MSEEVNLSEESNNPKKVLDQDELLEKVDEMRQLIHQQRFTECKPLLEAVFPFRTKSSMLTVCCRAFWPPLSPI